MGQRQSSPKPQALKSLLRSRGKLSGELAERSAQFDQLGRLVREALPAPLAEQCLGAVIEQTTLVMLTSSGAWGSQLHFYQQPLLDAVRKQTGKPLTRVRIRVIPAPPAAVRQTDKTPNMLSDRSRDVIRAAADGIDDPALAAALRRLARKP